MSLSSASGPGMSWRLDLAALRPLIGLAVSFDISDDRARSMLWSAQATMKRMLTTPLLLALLAGCQAAPTNEASAADAAVSPKADPGQQANGDAAGMAEPEPTPEDFAAWLAAFRRDARAQGIGEATLDRALADVRYRPRIIELDRSQPEFVRPIWQYLDTAVSATRIDTGALGRSPRYCPADGTALRSAAGN